MWVRCLVDLWRRHKRPFFRGFLAGGTANTTSVNREPENMNNRIEPRATRKTRVERNRITGKKLLPPVHLIWASV